MNKTNLVKFFDKEAVTYNSQVLNGTLGSRWFAEQENAIVEAVIKTAKFEKALDIGVGNGRFTEIIADKTQQITAIDLSEQMISTAKHHLSQKANEKTTFIKGNFEEIDLQNELKIFDLIISFRVFKYFDDIEKSIVKVSRLLKKGGVCIIQYPNLKSYQGLLVSVKSIVAINDKNKQYLHSLNLVNLEQIKRCYLENNLEIVEIHHNMVIPYFIVSRIKNRFFLGWVVKIDNILKKIWLKKTARDFTIVGRKI